MHELQGITIVCVDDHVDSLDLLAFLLSSRGATVLKAETSLEALNIICETTPHLVITDLALPGVDGYQLTRAIRAKFRIPVIVVSAHCTAQDIKAAVEAGAVEFLQKPFDEGNLMRCTQRALRQDRHGHAA